MDKKVVIFFALFALVMIGGSLVLSLWFIPKYLVPYSLYSFNARKSGAGMIQPQPEKATSDDNPVPRHEGKASRISRIRQIPVAGLILLLVGIRLIKTFRSRARRPDTVQGYIFKITRLTGKSEYDVFCKAAEDWQVSKEQIEDDFIRFMSDEIVPYYVNDFIRKNKKHIDELSVSIFQFKGH